MGVTKSKSVIYFVLFRILLVITIIASILQKKYVNLILAIITLVLSSIPNQQENKYRFEAPTGFEVTILVFIYLSLFLKNILFFVENFWWLEDALRFILAIIAVMIGFFLIYVINRDKQATINLRPSFIAFFAFTFALAAAVGWEIFKYLLLIIFDINLLVNSSNLILKELSIHFFGALFASIIGYLMIKYFGQKFVNILVSKFANKYPNLIKSVAKIEDIILQMVKGGENEKLEFKATIRTNIHTKEHDRRIEHSLLKTIVAFLNSSGGTLLVGVSDEGEIVGLELDKFKNFDKIKLHLVMLIRKHITNSHNAPIDFDVFKINDKTVMKIECGRSKKQTFLNHSGEEEFFIRKGPSSIKLSGSRLVDYITGRFKIR